MGRVAIEQRTIGGVTKTIRYGYNKDGSLYWITYSSGSVLKYSHGNDGRPVSLVDSTNSINYATNATYAPQGGLASIVYGEVSGGFAGITTSNSYNSRLSPTVLSASSSNATALSLSYTYFANGNVNVETNGRDNGRTATYTYDALNRVSTASSQATSGSDCWGQSFTYDRYANLTTINVTQCSAPILGLSANTNNQITNTGFTYDADGDLTADGVYTYTWNAEQHLKSAASVTYTYDGDLKRVGKSNGTLYWYSPGGVPLAETDTSGNTLNEYVFFGSVRVARRDSSGNVYYYFGDHLGTATTLSNASGVLCYDADFLPFGYEKTYTASCPQNYKFTGLERDGETGLDHTLNRKYDSSLGRWLTPDPKAGDALNPQSWNRYAYVLNNPATLTDPAGPDPDASFCASVETDTGEETYCLGGAGPAQGAGSAGHPGNKAPKPTNGRRIIPLSYVAEGQKYLQNFSTSSSACQKDLAALGLTPSGVQNCASNTPMVNVLTSNNITLIGGWKPYVDFAVWPDLQGTQTIFYNPNWFWQTSFSQLLGTLVHEYAHVVNPNLTDAAIAAALNVKITPTDDSSIALKLATDCFSGVKDPTQ
jgi:RHS repeat-associated protein